MSTTNVSPREMGTPCLQEGGDEAAKPRIAHTKGGRDGGELRGTTPEDPTIQEAGAPATPCLQRYCFQR